MTNYEIRITNLELDEVNYEFSDFGFRNSDLQFGFTIWPQRYAIFPKCKLRKGKKDYLTMSPSHKKRAFLLFFNANTRQKADNTKH